MNKLSKAIKKLIDPGKDARDKLTRMQEDLAAQQEKERQQMIARANDYNYANSQFLNNYLNSLNHASQLTYNTGVSNAYAQAQNAENQIRQNLARRGVTSGVDIRALADNQGILSRYVSQLQGQKYMNDADLERQRYNLNAENNANSLNRLNNAYSYQMPVSQATQNQMSALQEKANQRSPLLGLITTGVNLATGNIGGAALSGLFGNKVGGVLGNIFGNSKPSAPATNYFSGYTPTPDYNLNLSYNWGY